MEHYLILAQYTKSKKNLWWLSSDNYSWKKGQKRFISGTTTEVKILDVISITDEQYDNLNIKY
jgi:hypothetical protein